MTLSPKATLDDSDVGGAIRDMSSAANGLTARAGGGQALATPINTAVVRFTVAATLADSARLPAALAGARCSVYNSGAAAMNVFPSTGQAINAGAADAAFSLPAAKGCIFFCAVNGIWNTILGA